jgi:hypothetical protein
MINNTPVPVVEAIPSADPCEHRFPEPRLLATFQVVMSVRCIFIALVIAIHWTWLADSRAETVKAAGAEYQTVQQAGHAQYILSMSAVQRGSPDLDVLFGFRDPDNFYRLVLEARSVRLAAAEGGKERVLASHSGRFLTHSGGQKLVIQRGKHRLSVVANGMMACHVLDATFHEGAVCVRSDRGLDITALKYQPLEAILFQDDFMQTEEEANDLGDWEPASGKWELLSVLDMVRRSGDVQFRKGRQPEAERSPNPFSLAATGPEESVITTGYPFWHDYSVEAAGKTSGGQFGLVFGYQGPDDCFILRWALDLPMPRPGEVELVARAGKKERVLGEAWFHGRTDNWYRLHAAAVGGRIRAGIDGVTLFDLQDDTCTGGKIGLFSKGGEAAFDDVKARSEETIRFDLPELVRKHGSAIGGPWAVSDERGSLELSPKEAEPSIYGLGDVHWREYLVQCQGRFAAETTELGLICGPAEPGTYLLCRLVSGKGEEGTLDLVRISNSVYESVARFPAHVPRNQWLELALDLREQGLLKFYVDGQLEVRHRLQTAVTGKPALYAMGRGTFRELRAFGEMERDWQRSVGREIYVNDPYMQGWASPRWAWLPVHRDGPGGTPTLLYKGDVFGTVRLEWPVTGAATFFFARESDRPDEGHAVEVNLDAPGGRCQVELRRKGTMVARGQAPAALREAPVPGSPQPLSHWGDLKIQREGRYLWASLDGKELLGYRDDGMLQGTNLGIVAPKGFNTSLVRVERDHVKDYLFEGAPVDWERVGTWEVTNRFSCDPRWSHMNGESFGLAALWNKFTFTGDFTIEFYAGMRMRQGEMREGVGLQYPRVGDINLSVCGDGKDMFSGYSVILAAWDPWWSEQYSKLYRGRELAAQTDRELIPRSRVSRPVARAIGLEWDPGGRPVHGAWYYVKLRRRAGLVDVFFDDVKVMSYADRRPLDGGQFALWTQDNSIVVARAKIAYEKPPVLNARAFQGTVPALQAGQRPAFNILSETHPGLTADFERDFSGWEAPRHDQSALLSLDSTTKSQGRSSLKLVNMHAGGDFGVQVPLPRMDLTRVTELSFDYQIPKEVRVNLYLKTEEEPDVYYYVLLTGDQTTHAAMARVGDFGAVADGRWHRATVSLGDALKAADPWRRQFTAKSLRIGNYHEGYLNAGFDGNPAGATYHLDDFRLLTNGGNEAEFALVGAEGAEIEEFKWLVDGNPATSPQKAGQTVKPQLSVPPAPPEPATKGQEQPEKQKEKAANGRQTEQPRYVAALNAASYDIGTWHIHATARLAGGRWTEPQHYRFEATPPLAVERVIPEPGSPWGGEPVTVRFERGTDARLVGSSVQLSVAGKPVPVKEPVVRCDSSKRELAIDLQKASLTFKDGEKVVFALKFGDNRLSVAPPRPNAPSRGEWVKGHPQAWQLPATTTHEWDYTMGYGQDKLSPSKVEMADRLLDEDFEESVGGLVSYSGPYGAVLALDPSTPDGSQHSLRMTNKVAGGYSGVTLLPGKFDIGRFPLFCFDYRTDGHLRADFQTSAGGVARGIGFTDHDSDLVLAGSVPATKTDGQWHHAEFSVKAMMDAAMSAFNANHYKGSGLILGDFGYRANPPGVTMCLDNLRLVPAVSSAPQLELKWSARDVTGIAGYSYKWSKNPKGDPGKKVLTTESAVVFRDLPDGEQYLHIRAQDMAGNWGPVADYRYLIDNKAPKVVQVVPRDGIHSASATVEVGIEEIGAGIDPSSFVLTQNGAAIPLDSRFATCDVKRGVLAWHWAKAQAPMTQPIKHGTAMEYKLAPVKDFVGNESKPVSWTWRIDHSTDHEGPARPAITCSTQTLVSHDSFAENLGAWRPLGAKGAELSLHLDEERRDSCLKIVTAGHWDDSAAFTRTDFDCAQCPLVSFDYKFPRDARLMLRVYIHDRFACIKLTKEPEGYDNLGDVPGIVADGKWHHADVNLLEIAKRAFPEAASHPIRQVAIGNWTREFDQGRMTYFIDDFTVAGQGGPAPVYHWRTYDPTGIAGFSFLMDRNPFTEPEAKVLGTSLTQHLPVIDEPGLWYFHLRARDGAGNWGAAVHSPYHCTDTPPPGADGLEAQPGWLATAGEGTALTLTPLATHSGKNTLLSIVCTGAAKKPMECFLSHPTLKSAAGKRRLTLNGYLWGQGNVAICLAAQGPDKKPLAAAAERSMSAKAWHQGPELPLTDQDFWRKAKGSPSGPEESGAGLAEIGLKIKTEGPTAHILLDSLQVD